MHIIHGDVYITVKVVGEYAASVLECNVGDFRMALLHHRYTTGTLIKFPGDKVFFLTSDHFEWDKEELLQLGYPNNKKEEVSCL
jgi:hypothetical protein